MLEILRDLESLHWLTLNEQKQMIHTFIETFSRQYGSIHSLMNPSLTAKQNRQLSLAIINYIKEVTKNIMANLYKRKISMMKYFHYNLIFRNAKRWVIFSGIEW